jgi:hypothetical protein
VRRELAMYVSESRYLRDRSQVFRWRAEWVGRTSRQIDARSQPGVLPARTQSRPLECAAPHVAFDTPSPKPQQVSRGGHADRWLPEGSPFVGRDDEQQRLLAGFEAAEAGHGARVMLVGEPGIGKTALCHQLASHVAARGGRPLVGHCYEQGSLRRPYQPFVEVLESFARACDADTLRALLGSHTEEIARIVPAVRDQLQVQLTAPGDPEEDRLRLLTTVLEFVRSAAVAQPLALVLEDSARRRPRHA